MNIPRLKKKPELKLFQKCENTPLSVFIDCVVNKNYQRLVISGKATPEQLSEAWQTLWYEYCDLNKSANYTTIIEAIKLLSFTKAKLTAIRLCVSVLRHSEDKDCIDLLKKYGYNYKFDRTRIIDYHKALDRVLLNSNALEITIKQAEKQIEDLNKEAEQKEEVKVAEIWAENIERLSKYVGYEINPDTKTVLGFIKIRQMYEAEIEAMRKATEKLK